MFFSEKVPICLLVILSFSTLSISQTNEREPIKGLIPGLKPSIVPKSSIHLDTNSEIDSDPMPPSELDIDSESSMAPSPGTQQKVAPQPSSGPEPNPDSESVAPSPGPDSETDLPTDSDDDGIQPSSTPKPSPAPRSNPKSTSEPETDPKPTPEPSSEPPESDDDPNSTTGEAPEKSPATKSPPNRQGSRTSPQPTPSTGETPSKPTKRLTSPYHTVNNFCLYKRLNVNRIFCLKVLKNPKAANATSDDYTPLLKVAIKATMHHVTKTLRYLNVLYKDNKTNPDTKPSIRECVIAYQEIAKYIKLVSADASQELAIAGLDAQVIVEDINRCIRAVPKRKIPEVGEMNQIAKNYAKLLSDIAD